MGMTNREPLIGWEAIQPTRSIDPLAHLALRIWRLRDRVIEQGWSEGAFDHPQIAALAALAAELEQINRGDIECHCVIPEQSCGVCRAAARAVFILAQAED